MAELTENAGAASCPLDCDVQGNQHRVERRSLIPESFIETSLTRYKNVKSSFKAGTTSK